MVPARVSPLGKCNAFLIWSRGLALMSDENSKSTFPASSAAAVSTVVCVYDIKNLRITDGSIMPRLPPPTPGTLRLIARREKDRMEAGLPIEKAA
jgi:hypothetical protein